MGVMDGQNAPTDKIMKTPLIRKFGNDLEVFKAAVSALGGTYEGKSGYSHSWIISLLPKIPVKVVFDEADEEFPADIKIMFDETAPVFMDFECLAFLCGCFVKALIGEL